MQNPFTRNIAPKHAAMAIGVVLLILAGAWFGPAAFRKLTDRPAAPGDVRNAVWKYLAKRSGTDVFTVDLGSVTNSVAESTADAPESNKRKNRRNQSGGQGGVYSKYFQQKESEAATYAAIYKTIGQELKLGETLVGSGEEKQSGMELIMRASRFASSPAEDPGLAARICEGFIWPEAESTNQPAGTAEQLLGFCENAFRDAGETNNLIRNYHMLLTKAQGTQVDITRFRLSRVLEDSGRYKEALACLKQMTNTNKNGYRKRVAALEERVKTGL
jgi:hypothetical protein